METIFTLWETSEPNTCLAKKFIVENVDEEMDGVFPTKNDFQKFERECETLGIWGYMEYLYGSDKEFELENSKWVQTENSDIYEVTFINSINCLLATVANEKITRQIKKIKVRLYLEYDYELQAKIIEYVE